jgi:hypothetical protein
MRKPVKSPDFLLKINQVKLAQMVKIFYRKNVLEHRESKQQHRQHKIKHSCPKMAK